MTLDFAPPIRIPIVSADGRRVSGPWDMATVRGLQAEDGGSIDWSDLAAEERLRVGRRIVAAFPSDPEVAWGLLVVALETIEDGPMTQRARTELKRRVGRSWPAWAQAVTEAVERRRRDLEARRRSIEADRLRRLPPHLGFDHPGPWPTLDAEQRAELVETQRASVLEAVEGLDYEAVATGRTIVVGPGSVDAQAAFGVEVDRLQEAVVGYLGLAPTRIGWPGRMVVVRPPDLQTARVLAAAIHQIAWPVDATSLVVPTPEGPILVLPPIADPAEAKGELVRAVARGVLPYLDTGRRLPPWLVEGIVEAVADRLTPSLGIDRTRRARAHRVLRAGRDPIWMTTTPMEDAAWGSEGLARDLAHVMTVHLREHGPDAIGTVVQGLKRGEEIDVAFRNGVGMPLSAWTADALEWFHFND